MNDKKPAETLPAAVTKTDVKASAEAMPSMPGKPQDPRATEISAVHAELARQANVHTRFVPGQHRRKEQH